MQRGQCADTGRSANARAATRRRVHPKPNLPDFDEAPKPPYMRDLVLAHDGVRYPVLAGLAEDYIGYIVPAYNYVLDPERPVHQRGRGRPLRRGLLAVGPHVEQHAIHPILQLLQYRK